ncbi:hypothetical protein HYC85_017966, partial [Camellia sinensis]
SRGNRNRCSVPGILFNSNTLEGFHALDKQSLLKAEANKIWEDIHSRKAEEDSATGFSVVKPGRDVVNVSNFVSMVIVVAYRLNRCQAACNEWCNSSATTVPNACDSAADDALFFLVSIASNSYHLKYWESSQHDGHKFLFGFYDPCHLPSNPGSLICSRWNLERIHIFCCRENRGFADLSLSLIGEAFISVSQGWKDNQHIPNAVGWELNKGKKVPRCISLTKSIDPTRLAISVADLNLKLMRLCALPPLNINILSGDGNLKPARRGPNPPTPNGTVPHRGSGPGTGEFSPSRIEDGEGDPRPRPVPLPFLILSVAKCLVLGAGTLRCQVARMVMVSE